jgi:hypothetical protein
VAALTEAVDQAVAALPANTSRISVAWLSVSSLYSSTTSTVVISTLLDSLKGNGMDLEHLIGSSVAGCVSSRPASNSGDATACRPIEYEGVPAVSLTLACFPDTQITSFYLTPADGT